jgi:AcrR family transcriptional regulator
MYIGSISSMKRPVKRRYDSSSRREAAERTRAAILASAQRLLTARGYAAFSMKDVAAEAGVALDTVYASVGRKPQLLRELLEGAISGTGEAVPASERQYVKRIRAAQDARAKLDIYAHAVADIHVRLAPLVRVLRDAAAVAPELAALWQEISARRRRNMALLAADLLATGELRAELAQGEIADVLWSMNAPEFYMLLVDERGWSPKRFARWLADAWGRLLLR